MSGVGIDESRLTVLLDVRQPQAYLALHPTAALAAECGVAVDWLPVVTEPLKAPSEPRDDDDRGVRHRRYRAQAIAREIETYARVQGLVVEDYYRNTDPSTLNLAWLWLREHDVDCLLPFLAAAFRAHWACVLDVSREDAVVSLLEGCGAAAPEFQSWRLAEGTERADSLAEDLRERGLARAPTYLLHGEVFVGRQHLPMLRWILEGRAGRGPI